MPLNLLFETLINNDYPGHKHGTSGGSFETTSLQVDDGGYDVCYLEVRDSIWPAREIRDFLYTTLIGSHSTWIALAGSIGLVLPSGGPVAFLYGFLFVVLCNFTVAASLGELAAIWPTAGGQYHYVYALCTERWKKIMVMLASATLR